MKWESFRKKSVKRLASTVEKSKGKEEGRKNHPRQRARTTTEVFRWGCRTFVPLEFTTLRIKRSRSPVIVLNTEARHGPVVTIHTHNSIGMSADSSTPLRAVKFYCARRIREKRNRPSLGCRYNFYRVCSSLQCYHTRFVRTHYSPINYIHVPSLHLVQSRAPARIASTNNASSLNDRYGNRRLWSCPMSPFD